MNPLRALLLVLAASSCHAADGVQITERGDHLDVQIAGQPFTKYWFTLTNHPSVEKNKAGETVVYPARHTYLWPIAGPGGTPMTRAWPMQADSQGEDKDHRHHRGLWFAHGSVNGVDFWSEDHKAGRVEHEKFLEVKSGADVGVIRERCRWVTAEGKLICTDERTMRFHNGPDSARLLDFEITLHAPKDGPVVLGDTKEGTMAIRVNETLRVTKLKKEKGTGHIVLSTGVLDKETWGKAAEWCDYNGPVNGRTVGVALFNHPQNPVHPTWWHVRDYGLFAANPFGVHDFEKKPAGAGDRTIAAGGSATFRYRFYFHEGDEKAAKVAERYAEYAAGK